ncbi:nitrite/sulfite reductase [Alkalilimnicola sp. S0819]|uniref:nitrite/sulfite reductase n=1 Tax=Alkalilimnicola sp. S0819 TaxID=2613922 RepID=UPI0012626C84|nr:nitrite/sulfite reductase [Alkalilimnicola sp. S0819]KAB7623952.1 nitrite/sulfite reductase [Alkalilimnicola sp. S0819]MPQ16552.1 nitrite/sulfite reductase [Alkalilimnicola sp. S0819]
MTSWKERLAERTDPELTREIDAYQQQLELRKQGKIEDNLFQETRLRRGVYGQRYDNGQRHDGIAQRTLGFPCGDLRKGPETLWDAPGMMRIKIPFGELSPERLEVLSDLAEEYSDAVCHVTTRQDIQLHYVHIEDTPDLMRRLAAVGITSREACGNSVRNITACHKAGCCRGETFDVTPYARAAMRFLLGHQDTQDFGRKFKVTFSGCAGDACGLTSLHDLGYIAKLDEQGRRGFAVYVGGGLGPVPYQAKLFDEFVPEEQILPLAQAISRVFARYGEKKNRGRARMKFLVHKWGIEDFRAEVIKELEQLPEDPAWTAFLEEVAAYGEQPAKPGEALGPTDDALFEAWRASNTYRQRQSGYAIAMATLPLGDFTSQQGRQLADIARRYNGGHIRGTVDQNIVLRWVSEADLPALHADLQAIGLGQAGAGTITDVTSCPGTDTCKLGIASSRGLAAELSERLAAKSEQLDPKVRELQIKVSGCFNSCGQHHIADLGFYGVSRKMEGTTVPHFRAVLGARRENNAHEYGQTIGAIPSRRVPEFVDRLTSLYLEQREGEERFPDYIKRLGKKGLKPVLEEFSKVPPKALDRSYYTDWRDAREFNISDIGTGECAGAVISRIDFDLQEAERLHFEGQIALEEHDYRKADETAYAAMLEAAKALVRTQKPDVATDADTLVSEFRTRLYDSGLFQDRFAGGKFAQYLFRRHEDRDRAYREDDARHLLEETQLFIEAAYACQARLDEQPQRATGA